MRQEKDTGVMSPITEPQSDSSHDPLHRARGRNIRVRPRPAAPAAYRHDRRDLARRGPLRRAGRRGVDRFRPRAASRACVHRRAGAIVDLRPAVYFKVCVYDMFIST